MSFRNGFFGVLTNQPAGTEWVGLTHYYKLEGSPWPDAVGGSSLSATGTVTTATGAFGSAMTKATGANYLSRAGLGSGPYSQFTACAWIKTSSAGESTIIGQFSSGGNDRGWTMRIGQSSGDGRLKVFIADGDGSASKLGYYSATGYNNNVWHHFGFTFNAGALILYINGSAVGSPVLGINTGCVTIRESGQPLTLGAEESGTVSRDAISIDEAAIFAGTAKSPTDIAAIHAGSIYA